MIGSASNQRHTSRPLDQSGPSECPPLDVALMESVSATDSVPQNDHAVAEPVLVNQFQLQPHTIREEPFSGVNDRMGRRTFEARQQDQPLTRAWRPGSINGDVVAGVALEPPHYVGIELASIRVRTLRG